MLEILDSLFMLPSMNPTANARRLRREQTDEEKELWRALRAGRFAGFKFRRQHPLGHYILDFFCPAARLSIELDGFQHGLPEHQQRDVERLNYLSAQGIEELRFWNRAWRQNRDGVLLAIWEALHRRTGCVQILRKEENNQFIPPEPKRVILKKKTPA
jgi:very-short-patch-repair endonuclease